jgi:hypothetical protein
MGDPPHARSRFRQQRLRACRPSLTPLSTAALYTCLAVLSLAVGAAYASATRDLLHLEFSYTDGTDRIDLVPARNYSGPFYVYYRLANFYQNHFLYSESRNWEQLEGGAYSSETDLDSCAPAVRNASGAVLVPCGAVALSIFNDTFTFSSNFPNIQISDISLPQFRDLFKSPNAVYRGSDEWLDPSLFPDGQKNERFINWQRIAPMSSFLKLWGRTTNEAVLIAGVNYTIDIQDNFPVTQFGGEKSLVIAQTTSLGGHNPFFGPFFFGLGGVSALASIIFFVVYCVQKHTVLSRSGDTSLSLSTPLIDNEFPSGNG